MWTLGTHCSRPLEAWQWESGGLHRRFWRKTDTSRRPRQSGGGCRNALICLALGSHWLLLVRWLVQPARKTALLSLLGSFDREAVGVLRLLRPNLARRLCCLAGPTRAPALRRTYTCSNIFCSSLPSCKGLHARHFHRSPPAPNDCVRGPVGERISRLHQIRRTARVATGRVGFRMPERGTTNTFNFSSSRALQQKS